MKHWTSKFRNALRGLWFGTAGQSSFVVHIPIAIAVLAIAGLLKCEAWQWCALALCISVVLSLELVNSSIEKLAKGLCHEHNESVGQALDIASGAVLLASCIAALIGLGIFLLQLQAIV